MNVMAGPPYDVSRIRRASAKGSASRVAMASASTTGAAVRQPMIAPDAEFQRPLAPLPEDLGMAVLSASSVAFELGMAFVRADASRALSAAARRRRPASSQDEGGVLQLPASGSTWAALEMMILQSAAACVASPSWSPVKKASVGGLPAAVEMAVVSSASVLPNATAMEWMTWVGESDSAPGMTRPAK